MGKNICNLLIDMFCIRLHRIYAISFLFLTYNDGMSNYFLIIFYSHIYA